MKREAGQGSDISLVGRVRALQQAKIFENISGSALSILAGSLEHLRFEPGQVLLTAAAPGDCMYLLLDGVCGVEEAGKSQRVDRPGAMLGEMTALASEPVEATVTAETEVEAFRIGQEQLREAMAEQVEITKGVMKGLVQTLREMG